MKTYSYSYKTKKGIIERAKIQAVNVAQARLVLKENNIFPIAIKEDKSSKLFLLLFGRNKVSPDDILIFSDLMAGTLKAGLNIKESLDMLVKQIKNPVLKNRIADIIVDIDSGTQLSTSFAKHTDIFPAFYPMILKAGEASGKLGEVMDYIASYLERTGNIRKELKGIFTYPAIVGSIGILLLGVILVFVAPVFQGVFKETKMKLPLPTQILFFISDIIKNHYLLIFFFALLIGIGFYYFRKSITGRRILDRFVIDMPLIGPVIRDAMILRFLRTFEILVNNDVPILQALQVLEDSTTNLILKDVITEMRRDVAKGMPIAGPLIEHKEIISPLVSYSVSMGEKSGKLGETLTRIGNFIDKELFHALKSLSSRLDPLITLVLGVAVLFIASSIYLPMFDLITSSVSSK